MNRKMKRDLLKDKNKELKIDFDLNKIFFTCFL